MAAKRKSARKKARRREAGKKTPAKARGKNIMSARDKKKAPSKKIAARKEIAPKEKLITRETKRPAARETEVKETKKHEDMEPKIKASSDMVMVTDIDKLMHILEQRKEITLTEVAKTFNIPANLAERWGEMLSEQDLITLDSPLVGDQIFLLKGYKSTRNKNMGPTALFLLSLFILLLLMLKMVNVI